MTTSTTLTKTINVKGGIVSKPKYTKLATRSVLEFKFRRCGLTYLAKIYSSLKTNNLAWRKYISLKEGNETALLNAKYQKVSFTAKDGAERISYQIIVNG